MTVVVPNGRDSIEDRDVVIEAKRGHVRTFVSFVLFDRSFKVWDDVLVQARQVGPWFSFQEKFCGGEPVVSGSDAKCSESDVEVGQFSRFEDMFDRLNRSLRKAI